MAISLPLLVNDQLSGTCFIAGGNDKNIVLITTLHQIGNGNKIQLLIPAHAGDVSVPQIYPLIQSNVLDLSLVIAEPFLDIAVLLLKRFPDLTLPPFPRCVMNVDEVKTGEEVLVVGYPYSPIGSVLETVQICYVSALGYRQMGIDMGRRELILSAQTYSGSSGSPVIRRSDGSICGVVRGCLAPPSGLSIGNMPLGTDSNITYATSGHIIPDLISEALNNE